MSDYSASSLENDMTWRWTEPDAAELVARIEKLERRLAKLERAMKPAKVIESVYYRDGKPLRGKPRKE